MKRRKWRKRIIILCVITVLMLPIGILKYRDSLDTAKHDIACRMSTWEKYGYELQVGADVSYYGLYYSPDDTPRFGEEFVISTTVETLEAGLTADQTLTISEDGSGFTYDWKSDITYSVWKYTTLRIAPNWFYYEVERGA